jgi:glycosyltransferase involved in cell wall biosynthesis
MPEISVIINAQNGEKYLRQAIDSVFAQTFRDIELIVFDDASTDGTGNIACSYGNRIIYLRSETQVPLGKARNLALRSARGVYVAFLDQDDIWLPEKLECQHRVFSMYGDTALVYTNVTVFNDGADFT